jgi:hypothetical protein
MEAGMMTEIRYTGVVWPSGLLVSNLMHLDRRKTDSFDPNRTTALSARWRR